MNTNSLPQVTDKDLARFAAKVQFPKAGPDDITSCWFWTGAKHGQGRGYGKFRLGGKMVSAHKAAYLMFRGPVTAGNVLGHSCNQENCCAPHHLTQQSQSENMKYAVYCGRHNSQQKG